MGYTDGKGRPIAMLTFAVGVDGDTQLNVNLSPGGQNLPVILAAIDVLDGIGFELQEGGEDDEGGGEDAQPLPAIKRPTKPLPKGDIEPEVVH